MKKNLFAVLALSFSFLHVASAGSILDEFLIQEFLDDGYVNVVDPNAEKVRVTGKQCIELHPNNNKRTCRFPVEGLTPGFRADFPVYKGDKYGKDVKKIMAWMNYDRIHVVVILKDQYGSEQPFSSMEEEQVRIKEVANAYLPDLIKGGIKTHLRVYGHHAQQSWYGNRLKNYEKIRKEAQGILRDHRRDFESGNFSYAN